MSGQYEVLSPWAEVDPVPARGITPRLTDLEGKTIGLFCSARKAASHPILTAVEQQLKERFPTSKSRWFMCNHIVKITQTEDKAKFEEWIKGIDAAVAAVGD